MSISLAPHRTACCTLHVAGGRAADVHYTSQARPTVRSARWKQRQPHRGNCCIATVPTVVCGRADRPGGRADARRRPSVRAVPAARLCELVSALQGTRRAACGRISACVSWGLGWGGFSTKDSGWRGSGVHGANIHVLQLGFAVHSRRRHPRSVHPGAPCGG